MKTKKLNNQFILKCITVFFFMLVLANANIGGYAPFCYSLFYALMFVGFDEKLSAIFCLASVMVLSPTLSSFLIAISSIAVGLIIYYIHRLLKREIHIATLTCGYLISFVTQFYYHHSFRDIAFFSILAVIGLFVFINILQVMAVRKNCFRVTLDESVCFMFAIGLIGIGLSSINIYGVELYRLVLILTILCFASTGNIGLNYAITLSFSLGVSLSQMSVIPLAEFATLTLLAGVFTMPHKLKISLCVLLAEIFVQYIFIKSGQPLYQILPIVIGLASFNLIPNKWLNSLSELVYVKRSELSTRNIINTTRKNIKKRMSELSNVFLDMKHIHLNMVKKELTKDELIAMLIREVTNTTCKDCIDKHRCNRGLGTDNKSNLEYLVEIAVSKGKITLLDLPSGMTARCGKVNYLISTINRLCDEYKQYRSMLGDVNNVKILLADQMGAVSRLLLDIGDEIDANVSFDIARENKIINKLLSQNVECREVLLYTEKNQETSAVLVIKGTNEDFPTLEKTMTESMKCPMHVTSVTPMENGDFLSITLRRKNKYDVIFGLASCNKAGNEECGDCHSIIRLGDNKFLLALCDGMGSGKSAHRMSAMTLGLIENFYKVGFDNDIILESVNKLLAITNQENYSTLDICLLDLNLQIADFIKVGSPFGIVKRDNNIEIIEGGALPIGALDSVTPFTKKTTITTKDIVIMATDGIMDAFETEENMTDFVSHLATNNPQTIAEAILNEALHLNEMHAKDDMTVLVSRIYLK